jgi:hypothetical protein
MELSTILSIISIFLTAASMIWVGGFRLSAIIHEIETIKGDVRKLETSMERGFEKIDLRFEKLENKLEALQTEVHKHDIRITTLEQHRPG